MAFPNVLRLLFLLVAFPLFDVAGAAPVAKNQTNYAVYVTPQLAPEVMHKAWAPLLDAISRESGVRLTLSIPPSIAGFEALLLRGLPDFAFSNPYMMLPARKAHGYIPLVRNGKVKLVGHLLVRKDSPAKTLADLQGATIAFPAPNAYAASLYIRAELARQNVRFTPVYVSTHSNVYRHVLFGQAAAGGGVNISLDREPVDIKGMLRSIYSTPPLVTHPLAAHPRVPPQVREAVTNAILRLAARPENQALFSASQIPEPIRADYLRDYAPLEALGLDRFLVFGED